jgi:uncharacterized membrane protein YhhN
MGWLLFLLFSVAHLTFICLDMPYTRPYSIIPLMPILAYTLYQQTGNRPKFIKYAVIGLLFGWLGDIALSYDGLPYFISGLVSFLLGHLFYVATFKAENKEAKVVGFLRDKPFLILPYLALMLFVVIKMGPNLGDFKIPVFAYCAVILYMSSMALNRFYSTGRASAFIVLIGSLLFVFSDFMIAWNKFIEPVTNASFIIMITYLLGQLGIAYGLVLAHAKK